jgi:hypothetical protein
MITLNKLFWLIDGLFKPKVIIFLSVFFTADKNLAIFKNNLLISSIIQKHK